VSRFDSGTQHAMPRPRHPAHLPRRSTGLWPRCCWRTC